MNAAGSGQEGREKVCRLCGLGFIVFYTSHSSDCTVLPRAMAGRKRGSCVSVCTCVCVCVSLCVCYVCICVEPRNLNQVTSDNKLQRKTRAPVPDRENSCLFQELMATHPYAEQLTDLASLWPMAAAAASLGGLSFCLSRGVQGLNPAARFSSEELGCGRSS